MRAERWLGWIIAVMLTQWAAGCGGLRVDGTTWREPRALAFDLAVKSFDISPTHDQLVTTCRECDLRRVHDLTYLLAGADEAGREWQAWLRFDLSALNGMDDLSRATLVLPGIEGATLTRSCDRALFEVRPVADNWNGETLLHQRRPRLSSRTVATVDVEIGVAGGSHQIDVTEAVQVALVAGRSSITFAIIPSDLDVDARWRFASVEAGESTDVAVTPRLVVEQGTSPVPIPSALR
jgi:hypothetical protein